jgi:hypothetical protein
MTVVWIVGAIALLLVFLWLFTRPKQGEKAANAPQTSTPDALPAGEYPARAVNPKFPLDVSSPSSLPPGLEAELQHLILQGQKIAAIKRIRDYTGWGLKAAKDYIDALPPMS